jgi:hypothetical protein
VWEVLDWEMMSLANFVLAFGARTITRLLLGFFEVVPNEGSLTCALASATMSSFARSGFTLRKKCERDFWETGCTLPVRSNWKSHFVGCSDSRVM